MSIFGSIMSSIFGGPASAAPAPPPPASDSTPPQSLADASVASTPQPGLTAAAMDELADKSDEDLDWRHSIVDLMKLLKLDSSLTARKKLAEELHFEGNTRDSAAMNIWLHKQVMIKLAESGGKVPSELKH
jgi:hypothetical protein